MSTFMRYLAPSQEELKLETNLVSMLNDLTYNSSNKEVLEFLKLREAYVRIKIKRLWGTEVPLTLGKVVIDG